MTPAIWPYFRKDLKHSPGHGYGRMHQGDWIASRPGAVLSIVIHSTNGNKGSSLSGEAGFLRDSPDVSCHDLIGKDGTIVEILPPEAMAWHAGNALPEFGNHASIGIELHHAKGDDYPAAQMEALTWRVTQYIEQFALPREAIDTHRAIALPRGRKIDPSDWSSADFYAWRTSLYQPDWERLWGTKANYRAHWGIPSRWRELHVLGKDLGMAQADEFTGPDGVTYQRFARGILTWTEFAGVNIYREEE